MTYQQSSTLDLKKDLILPLRKGEQPQIEGLELPKKLDFEADLANFHTLYSSEGNKIYLLGLGETKDSVKIGQAFQKVCYKRRKYWGRRDPGDGDRSHFRRNKESYYRA